MKLAGSFAGELISNEMYNRCWLKEVHNVLMVVPVLISLAPEVYGCPVTRGPLHTTTGLPSGSDRDTRVEGSN